jgi:hypothetical protein
LLADLGDKSKLKDILRSYGVELPQGLLDKDLKLPTREEVENLNIQPTSLRGDAAECYVHPFIFCIFAVADCLT